MTNIARRAGRARCNLCGDEKSATQMGNHITQELEAVQRAEQWRQEPTDLRGFLHIEIQHQRAKHFWMHLLVQHRTTLGQLDAFLRSAWLECCGHLSRFDFHGLTASSPGSRKPGFLAFDDDEIDDDEIDDDGELLIDWNTPAIRAMPPGMTGIHEYDFGSTTTLDITSHRSLRLRLEGDILLIARNAPVTCDVCEKEPARTLTPVTGALEDPDGQRHCGVLYVPLCQSCTPPQPDDDSADCTGECGICDEADDETAVPIPVVNSPRLYDADCFLIDELQEVAPRKGRTTWREHHTRKHDGSGANHGTRPLREQRRPPRLRGRRDAFLPGLDPVLDNVERWPNIMIMDSLLESAGRFTEDTPPPEAIIRALDGLEKLALARTLCDKTGDHHKYFEGAPDWTYTPRESDDAMAEQGDARQFTDDTDAVVADATLSWNDGNAIFMIGYLHGKGTLLAYFGPKP